MSATSASGEPGLRTFAATVRGHRYGSLLLIILSSLAYQLASPDTDWAHLVTIVLQGLALVLALRIAGAPVVVTRLAIVAVIIGLVAGSLALVGSGEDRVPLLSINLLFVGLAPAAIVVGLTREVRARRAVTLHTMFGVLCIYLLLGMLFAFAFAVIDTVFSTPFFAGVAHATPSDFLYFSFASLTTVGYGDLTAGADLGRSVAITEALIGQIYLVTVVALIVANIGRGARGRERA